MIIGKLNTKVDLNLATTTKDTYGSEIVSFEPILTTWCEVVSTKAMEKFKVFHDSTKTTKIIKIRDRDSLSALEHNEMQAIIDNESYRISHWFREYNEIIFYLETVHV